MERRTDRKSRREQITFLAHVMAADRHGAIVMIALLGMVVVVAVASLTIDVGHILYGKARLQNAADAAALAAAQTLLEGRRAGLSEEDAQASAALEAWAIMSANWALARCEVAFGSYDSGQFVALPPETPCTAVHVSAYRDEYAPGGEMTLFFAPLMGQNAVSVSAPAVCSITNGLKTVTSGLRPIAVPASFAESVTAGEEFTFDMLHGDWEPLYEGEELSPGNFGLVDLSGGGATTSELSDWMLNGYDSPITIDPDVGYTMIEGTTGIRASLKDELHALVGQSIFIAMYDQVDGNGANAQFRIVRFAAVTILYVDLTGNPKIIRMRLDTFTNVAESETGSSVDDNLVKIHLAQ